MSGFQVIDLALQIAEHFHQSSHFLNIKAIFGNTVPLQKIAIAFDPCQDLFINHGLYLSNTVTHGMGRLAAFRADIAVSSLYRFAPVHELGPPTALVGNLQDMLAILALALLVGPAGARPIVLNGGVVVASAVKPHGIVSGLAGDFDLEVLSGFAMEEDNFG